MEQSYLSVVIPAYQESRRIGTALQAIVDYLHRQSWTYEIIVVDDGSVDGTADVVKGFLEQEPNLVLLTHKTNAGKGAAVKTGMEAAKGKFCLFTDADNATPIEELPKLLSVAQRGVDVVIGSRYLPQSDVRKKQNVLRRIISRLGNLLFRVLLGLHFADTRCGFKLFSASAKNVVFSRQTLLRWGFDTEVLLIAVRHHLRVQEVPVTWFDRERGTVHPFRDSLRSLGEIVHMIRARAMGLYD